MQLGKMRQKNQNGYAEERDREKQREREREKEKEREACKGFSYCLVGLTFCSYSDSEKMKEKIKRSTTNR